jgi:hypothetical protein
VSEKISGERARLPFLTMPARAAALQVCPEHGEAEGLVANQQLLRNRRR